MDDKRWGPICTECGNTDFDDKDIIKDTVDIEVGIMEILKAAKCPKCGYITYPCDICGAWEGNPHTKWCNYYEPEG